MEAKAEAKEKAEGKAKADKGRQKMTVSRLQTIDYRQLTKKVIVVIGFREFKNPDSGRRPCQRFVNMAEDKRLKTIRNLRDQ